MASIDAYLPRTRIAYFSMEIGLRPDMHTYSGGLGVLAGDVARSAADSTIRATNSTGPSVGVGRSNLIA